LSRPNVQMLTLQAFNALTDLILILTGLAVIVSLKMRRSNKIVLCIILSLSSLYATPYHVHFIPPQI
jgi:hypothetical protein